MRKIFTIFLLAAMMCVSVCGCSNAPASSEPTPTAPKSEVEDAGAVPMVLGISDADALETAMPTEDIQANVWAENYMALMIESCLNGDFDTGRRAAENRNAKIDALGLNVPKVSFDELYELSKVITSKVNIRGGSGSDHLIPIYLDWNTLSFS